MFVCPLNGLFLDAFHYPLCCGFQVHHHCPTAALGIGFSARLD